MLRKRVIKYIQATIGTFYTSVLVFFSLSYYEYLWKHNKGVSFDDLFRGMPVALQADTSISLYKPIIDKASSVASCNTRLGYAGWWCVPPRYHYLQTLS